MSGLSIYLVFITAGLIALPQRAPWLAVLLAITVSAYWLNRDIGDRPPIIETKASDPNTPSLKQADHIPSSGSESRG